MKPKVLIGFDDREASADALALGAHLCRLLEAQPLVLSVAPWPRFLHGDDLRVALEIDTSEGLARAADRLADLDPVTKAVVHRSVSEEIGIVAKAEKAVAIVIGSCHRSALGKVLLGSVGRSLLHDAPCPVAVAPSGYRQGEGSVPRRIAVAFDGSPESWAALDTGIFLARTADAELGILTVAAMDFYMSDAAWPVVGTGEMIERERDYARQISEEAAAKVPDDVAKAAKVMQGPPCKLLADASGEYDLLILGSRGHGPMGRTVLGTVSGCVMDEAACPILVLPRGAKLIRHGLVEAGSGVAAGAAHQTQ